MNKKQVRYLVESAAIAALYAVLTLVLAPLSFGVVQVRVSEALVILPLFTTAAIPGLSIGCIISNFAGLAMGANIAGAYDVLFGTLATLLAALCTYALRNVKLKQLPILSFVPPVIFNALIVGGELAIALPAEVSFAMGFLSVGAGELVSVFGLGLPLYFVLKKTKIFEKFGR